jgi:hypothetical protein
LRLADWIGFDIPQDELREQALAQTVGGAA